MEWPPLDPIATTIGAPPILAAVELFSLDTSFLDHLAPTRHLVMHIAIEFA
jgi:hypothetical protein